MLDFLYGNAVDCGWSRTDVKGFLRRCCVKVDGRVVVKYDYKLTGGSAVEVEKREFRERFEMEGLKVVYEDRFLVVVDKGAGLLSVGRGNSGERFRSAIAVEACLHCRSQKTTHEMEPTVISELNGYFRSTHQRCNAHIVHRLDRDTSGLMVVAKSKEVSRLFEEDWKGLVYERVYVAVVWGVMERRSGTIRSWLRNGDFCVLSSKEEGNGKEAVTHYRVVECGKRYTMLELRLETGRRNQIRVQMREEGHPLVHDSMYGYKDDASPIGRLALHAKRLYFKHPVTGRDMRFDSEVPEEFFKVLKGF